MRSPNFTPTKLSASLVLFPNISRAYQLWLDENRELKRGTDIDIISTGSAFDPSARQDVLHGDVVQTLGGRSCGDTGVGMFGLLQSPSCSGYSYGAQHTALMALLQQPPPYSSPTSMLLPLQQQQQQQYQLQQASNMLLSSGTPTLASLLSAGMLG